MKRPQSLGAAAFLLALPFWAGAAVPDATALVTKYNCNACHTPDQPLVGPSFKDVAKKYAGDASARTHLAAKIKAGGSGVWGDVPMPPNDVPDADLKKVVDWILATS